MAITLIRSLCDYANVPRATIWQDDNYSINVLDLTGYELAELQWRNNFPL